MFHARHIPTDTHPREPSVQGNKLLAAVYLLQGTEHINLNSTTTDNARILSISQTGIVEHSTQGVAPMLRFAFPDLILKHLAYQGFVRWHQ